MKIKATLEVFYSTRDRMGNVYYSAILTNNKNRKSIPLYCECRENTEYQLRGAGLENFEFKTVEIEQGQRKIFAMSKELKYLSHEALVLVIRKFLNLRRKAA